MAVVIVGLVVTLCLDLSLLVYGLLKVMVDPAHRARLSESHDRGRFVGMKTFILTYLCPIVASWITTVVLATLVACVPWPWLVLEFKEMRRKKEKEQGGITPPAPAIKP